MRGRAYWSDPIRLYGQFATHNAHSIAAIMHLAGNNRDFEFQRLYGMGTALYAAAEREYEDFPALRTYEPVGNYDDLLPYLVRRLLENGANSSFVHRLLDTRLEAGGSGARPDRRGAQGESRLRIHEFPCRQTFSRPD